MTLQTICVSNPASMPRTTLVTCGLTFDPGQWDGVVPLRNDEYRAVQTRSHLYWPDGSVRWAGAEWVRKVDAEGLMGDCVRADPKFATPDFYLHPAVVPGLFGVTPRGFTALSAGRIDSGPVTDTWRSVWRDHHQGMWFEVTVSLISGLPMADFTLRYGWSDPTTKDLGTRLQDVWVDFAGAEPVVDFANAKVLDTHRGGLALKLQDWHDWGDGQMQVVTGRLLFWDKALTQDEIQSLHAEKALYPYSTTPPVAVSADWKDRPWLTPFGFLANPVRRRQEHGLAAVNLARGIRDGDPWQWIPGGLLKRPGDTGSQDEFGVVQRELGEAAALGMPDMLWPYQFLVQQDACRPVHHREQDGRAFVASEHPDCHMYQERPHWDSSHSPDRLGKTSGARIDPYAQAGGWFGRDRQHEGDNVETAMQLLTGKRWIVERNRERAQRWIACHGVDTPSPNINAFGAARAGRSLQAGAYLAWATGDPEVVELLEKRITVTARNHYQDTDGDPFMVRRGPDPRQLPVEQWNPWENAQRLLGWGAIAALLHRLKRRGQAGDDLGALIAHYGEFLHTRGWLISEPAVGFAVAVSEEDVAAGHVNWDSGFNAWSLPAAQLTDTPEALQIEQKVIAQPDAQHWRVR